MNFEETYLGKKKIHVDSFSRSANGFSACLCFAKKNVVDALLISVKRAKMYASSLCLINPPHWIEHFCKEQHTIDRHSGATAPNKHSKCRASTWAATCHRPPWIHPSPLTALVDSTSRTTSARVLQMAQSWFVSRCPSRFGVLGAFQSQLSTKARALMPLRNRLANSSRLRSMNSK